MWGMPCGKHMASKLDDHFMLGQNMWSHIMYSNECWKKFNGRCLVSPFEEDLDYSSAISILSNIYRKTF